MGLKEVFLKAYANLPQGAREEIIVVVNGEPYTWQAARLEIEQDTNLGKEILNTLEQLGILSKS